MVTVTHEVAKKVTCLVCKSEKFSLKSPYVCHGCWESGAAAQLIATTQLINIPVKPIPQLLKNIKDLQFCFDELLGELGWGDEIAETGVDPLVWARNEIKDLHKQIKRLRGSLELRDAASGKCNKCGALHAEPIIHCDICGAFQ